MLSTMFNLLCLLPSSHSLSSAPPTQQRAKLARKKIMIVMMICRFLSPRLIGLISRPLTALGKVVAPDDVMKMSNFCNNIFRGVRSTGGSKSLFSHWLLVIVTTVWSACVLVLTVLLQVGNTSRIWNQERKEMTMPLLKVFYSYAIIVIFAFGLYFSRPNDLSAIIVA